MGQYYYLDDAVPIGPLSLQDIYTLIDREVIGSATMVCREGGAEWLLLNEVPELKGKSLALSVTRSSSSESLVRSSSGEGSSRSSSTESRRLRKGGLNVTAIIIAALFSVVAVYVTYAITHQSQDTIQEMDHLPGR